MKRVGVVFMLALADQAIYCALRYMNQHIKNRKRHLNIGRLFHYLRFRKAGLFCNIHSPFSELQPM